MSLKPSLGFLTAQDLAVWSQHPLGGLCTRHSPAMRAWSRTRPPRAASPSSRRAAPDRGPGTFTQRAKGRRQRAGAGAAAAGDVRPGARARLPARPDDPLLGGASPPAQSPG